MTDQSGLRLPSDDEPPFSDPYVCPVCRVEKTVSDFPTPDACAECDRFMAAEEDQ